MGAKWGIKFTLICGLTLQLFAYGLLFAWNDDWPKKSAIIYVTFAQMFAGVAKDLTKLGGKTVTKLVRYTHEVCCFWLLLIIIVTVIVMDDVVFFYFKYNFSAIFIFILTYIPYNVYFIFFIIIYII